MDKPAELFIILYVPWRIPALHEKCDETYEATTEIFESKDQTLWKSIAVEAASRITKAAGLRVDAEEMEEGVGVAFAADELVVVAAAGAAFGEGVAVADDAAVVVAVAAPAAAVVVVALAPAAVVVVSFWARATGTAAARRRISASAMSPKDVGVRLWRALRGAWNDAAIFCFWSFCVVHFRSFNFVKHDRS
jgi:hypothetical protein